MTTKVQYDTGLQYARDGEYEKAVQEFSLLLLQDQTDVYGLFYRGCAYLHLNEYQKTIDDFTSAIALTNLSSIHELAAVYKRGYAYMNTNQFDSALDDYRLYLILCKYHVEQSDRAHKGLFQMGVIYARLNQYDSAILHFTRAIDRSAGSEEDKQKLYYLHRGRAYACCAEYDKAQMDLELVLKRSHDQFIRGCANNELGRHQDALKDFDSLLQSNRNQTKSIPIFDDHIRFRRGLSHASLNLHDEALSDFQDALNDVKQQGVSTISARILFHKGVSNMALNNIHRALIDLNASTKLNEYQSDVLYARSMINCTLGRHDAAIVDQRKAMTLDQEKSRLLTSVQGDDQHIHIYYGNKIREAEGFLKKNQNPLMRSDIYRMIAEYFYKQASCPKDPLPLYQQARQTIEKACQIFEEKRDEDVVALAINSFCIASFLAEKYSNESVPESVVEEYIKLTTEVILEMSKLFDKCTTTEGWQQLTNILLTELHKSNIQQVSHVDKVRNDYIASQLKMTEMIQQTMNMFVDSVAQQEFYKLFCIRLCNLFNGVHMISANVFSSSSQDNSSRTSWEFQLLGRLFEFVPIGLEYEKNVFSSYEYGVKKLNEKQIENAFTHMGNLGDQELFNKTADKIAKDLTVIYKNQINRFPTAIEEATTTAAAAATSITNQQEPTGRSKFTSCLPRSSRSLGRQKDDVSNKPNYPTIQTIVEYGISLSLSCLTQFKVKGILQIETVQNLLINTICRPHIISIYHITTLSDKVKPKDVKKEDEYWDTYDFYRRPAIMFHHGVIRARHHNDVGKFGCRQATLQEEQFLERNPEKLDSFGFKITK